jgi:hypothetical protein
MEARQFDSTDFQVPVIGQWAWRIDAGDRALAITARQDCPYGSQRNHSFLAVRSVFECVYESVLRVVANLAQREARRGADPASLPVCAIAN